MDGIRYRECGASTRRLGGQITAGEVRPNWCPANRTVCGLADGNEPCQHNGAWFGELDGSVMVCCHFGLESGDGGGDWGVPPLPALPDSQLSVKG
jgi:hypothetical protein